MRSKDPGPEGPALVHPGFRLVESKRLQLGERGDEGSNFYQQCSGVGCQQLKSTRWIGVGHERDFLSPVLTFSHNPISVQDSGFVFTDTWNLTPETMIRLDRWQSRSSLTCPTGPGFRFWINHPINSIVDIPTTTWHMDSFQFASTFWKLQRDSGCYHSRFRSLCKNIFTRQQPEPKRNNFMTTWA
jgi:hypothetical protein